MQTRVIVTGYDTPFGSFRSIDRGAKFRDAEDIERVTQELKDELKCFKHTKVITRETD